MSKSYLLKIRGGVEVDSQGKKAGKGPLISEEVSATLGVSQDQYLFQPITFEPGIAAREGGHIYEGVSGTLRSNAGDNQMHVAYCVMYTLNTIERHGVCYWDGGQTAGTLTANNAGGGQRMPDKNHFQCVIEAHSIGNGQVHDAMSPSKEVCKTLNCMYDPMKVVIVKSEDADR